jgi:hypothetical protein
MLWSRVALGGLLAVSVAACVAETGGSSSSVGALPPDNIPLVTDAGLLGDGAPSATPMLVKVDTNKTLGASAGEGVGVFAEYDAGGHWNLSWTCDTAISGQSCNFQINVSVSKGTITGATSNGFADPDTLVTTNAGLTATTTTSTTLQGMLFDSDPGAVITLSASLSGEYSGSFLFFVQDGEINGNFKGLLTDPLQLEGSSP